MRIGADLAAVYAALLTEARRRVPSTVQRVLTETDFDALPTPVQRWLHRSGALGRPSVRCFHIVYDATMFQAPGGKGLAGPAEQFNSVVPPMRRLFFMPSRMFGLPMAVLHDYEGIDASMRVRVARLVNVADQHDAPLARTETVTLLNDLCFWAPSSLIGTQFAWQAIDDLYAGVTFTNGPHQVRATLCFDAQGDLIDFRSNDRGQMQKDGQLKRLPWSTPMRDYQDIEGRRVPTRGEAIWHQPDGLFVYGRFLVRGIRFDDAALSTHSSQ